jgi:hypothetical protein
MLENKGVSIFGGAKKGHRNEELPDSGTGFSLCPKEFGGRRTGSSLCHQESTKRSQNHEQKHGICIGWWRRDRAARSLCRHVHALRCRLDARDLRRVVNNLSHWESFATRSESSRENQIVELPGWLDELASGGARPLSSVRYAGRKPEERPARHPPSYFASIHQVPPPRLRALA